MRAKKVVTVTGCVLLGLSGLLFIGKLGGCKPPGFKPGYPCAGFRGKGLADLVLTRLDKHVEELDLSQEQRKSYEEIRAKLEEHLSEGQARRQGLLNHVRAEINKDKPDVERMAAIIKDGMKEFPQHMERNLDLFVAFYRVLDEKQQKEVLERLRDRMKN